MKVGGNRAGSYTSCMVECGAVKKVHGKWEEGVNGGEEIKEMVG